MLRLRLLGLALLLLPSLASAETRRDRGKGFGIFARPLGAITINRVYCGLNNIGEFCPDSTNSSTVGGGYWPKGTSNQYIFNSGPVLAGIIASDGGPWAGDTAGAFFFDAKGSTQHGVGLTNIYNATSAVDRANWPEAGRVPGGAGSLFHPMMHDAVSASEGDVWWLMWEGDTTRLAGRRHPLGIAVEVRGLGWNYPAGNEDIVYFVLTYYNITSTDPADYAGVRPALRPELLTLANRFQAMSNAAFGITLPPGGYTITPMFTAIWNDMDVADAGQNYASTNLPMSLGYTYEHTFSQFAGWSFDPGIFTAPFFAGAGFGGITFLEQANGVGRTHLFSGITGGGGDLNDARDVNQLYRYLSATLSTAYGDGACNFNPVTQHLCFIRQTSASDIRSFQSTGPFILGPGQAQSVATAYVFAAPVRTGGSAICPACDIKPGAAGIIAGLSNPAIIAGGVNPIDSIAGFLGATDYSGDGVLQRDEFISVPRSLYGKTQLAQAIFDNQFLLPTGPAAPEFFLIPGDNKVTVIWRPSPTEQTGDPFYTMARDAMRLNNAGALVPNPLYDPNFRQFDVEGYRVYRGRASDPQSLQLLAQFDYAGTVIQDFAGQVQPVPTCAPELGITTDCPVAFDPVSPGQPRTVHVDVPLVGPVIQVRMGDRIELTDGTALILKSDTTGAGYQLSDNGVPFAYEDLSVRNNFRYVYSVTAFDVNSVQSGPASMESARVIKGVTPVRPAGNYENTAGVATSLWGRGVELFDRTMPTLDPVAGTFSKPMPPSDGWSVMIAAFVKEVVANSGAVIVHLDSLDLGDPYGSGVGGNCSTLVPIQYFVTILADVDTLAVGIPVAQDCMNVERQETVAFTALEVDPFLASRYGGQGTYTFDGQLTVTLVGNYYTNAFGRGCVNFAPGFAYANTPQTGCDYNGARWFDGPSPAQIETQADPNPCSAQNNTANYVTCYVNAGFVSGVQTIHEVKSYQTTPNVWRNVEGILGGAVRGTDYNVYWGSSGKIDSVIDVSHNVVVPFQGNRLGASWGILNQSAAQPFAGSYDNRTELTVNDMGCIEPLKSAIAPQAQLGCAGGPFYALNDRAIPGPIVLWSGVTTNARTTCIAGVSGCGQLGSSNGFVIYLAGHIFMVELTNGQVPSAGTVWTMRDYVGAIRGGGNSCALCTAGADGPYAFFPRTRPMAAVGAELRFSYDVINRVNAPTGHDLSAVHTVPDPYYLTNAFEADVGSQTIKFVNLPEDAIIRIYSSSGVLVTLLEHHSTTFGGALDWDLRNRTGRRVSSGVYFYHLEAGNARRVGRFTIVNDRPGF